MKHEKFMICLRAQAINVCVEITVIFKYYFFDDIFVFWSITSIIFFDDRFFCNNVRQCIRGKRVQPTAFFVI